MNLHPFVKQKHYFGSACLIGFRIGRYYLFLTHFQNMWSLGVFLEVLSHPHSIIHLKNDKICTYILFTSSPYVDFLTVILFFIV